VDFLEVAFRPIKKDISLDLGNILADLQKKIFRKALVEFNCSLQ
jgi:hypothetical protein